VKSSPPKTHCPIGRDAALARCCRRARKIGAAAAFQTKSNSRPPRWGHTQWLHASRHSQSGDARARRTNVEIVRENGLLKAAYPVVGEWKMKAFLFFNPKVNAAINKPRHPVSVIAAPAISLRNPAAAARIIDRINRAVSRGLQWDHRDDTISDMACAWLEGRLQEDDIEKRAGEFARSRFKSDHNKYGDLSLDVPIYVDGSTTLMDRLSTETESGYWDLNMMASTGRRK
jgi:hypothetical protein